MTVIVDIDHETGDLSQYTSTVTDSGDLSVAAGAALAGTGYGLSCVIDDTTAIYGSKTITITSDVVRVRFYFDPNSLTMAEGNDFFIETLSTDGSYNGIGILNYFTLWLDGGVYKVYVTALDDSGNWNYAGLSTITDAPHFFEYQITRETSDGSNDGTAQLWIDGVSSGSTQSALQNYNLFPTVTTVNMGAVSGLEAATSGTFYLDELIINNDGSEIGAYSAGTAVPVFMAHYRQRRA